MNRHDNYIKEIEVAECANEALRAANKLAGQEVSRCEEELEWANCELERLREEAENFIFCL